MDSSQIGFMTTFIYYLQNAQPPHNEITTFIYQETQAEVDATQTSQENQSIIDEKSENAETACRYEIDRITAQNTYETSLSTSKSTYESTKTSAFNTYNSSVSTAGNTFSELSSSLACLYTDAIGAIDNGGTIGNNYFSNPTEDAEVCFVTGTPILMADGTSKPIEEIRPGDMVLAVDHNNPEKDTPKPAKVTRFFDNGLKSVVKLIFENQETGEQFEVVCTPSHRFYVKNKGWINAGELITGDCSLNANGEEIQFFSRKNLEELHKVYNFEVEDKHSYFIVKDVVFLLHSINKKGTDCFKWCSDSGRELVIRNDHILEVDAARIGTFNYSLPSDTMGHFLKDVYPYWKYGYRNILDTQQMQIRANELQHEIDQFYFEHNFKGYDWY